MPSSDSKNRVPSLQAAFLGDIVGQPGRDAIRTHLPRLRELHEINLVIANAENAAGGTGLTPPIIEELMELGIDILTTGNHVWAKREVIPELDRLPNVIRPANYPPGAPGRGSCLYQVGSTTVAVLNLCGRVFMNAIDCPFRAADEKVAELRELTPIIIVDMHAEATSEKLALGHFLDGRVTAVIGTHTHVQTSDARILPGGTAYLSDAGMTGPSDSVLGMRKDIIITRFLSQLPQKFEVAKGPAVMEGVLCRFNTGTGHALSMETFRLSD
jgi:2',3'-cyclic-nucleotide 2'-phosphodiesterase